MSTNKTKNVMFVVTEMRLGGRERVVGRVADGLLSSYDKVFIYSIWNRKPFFKTKTPILFKRNLNWVPTEPKLNLNFVNSKFYKTVRLLGEFVAKNVFNYSFLQSKELNELIAIIKSQKIDTVVLTDLSTTFAKKIKLSCPNIRIISWFHMEPTAFFNVQYRSFRYELKRALAYVDGIVALTNEQKKKYSKYHGKVSTIANPMPNTSFLEYNPNIRLTRSELLVVSRIDVLHKGLDLLVRILSQLTSDWHLTFIGSGKLKDETEFYRLIKKYHLESKISLIGSRSGSELEKYYKNGAIFLMTSRFEGFPMSIGEAMASGLPIVSFDLDGVKEATGTEKLEYIGSSPAILVSQGNVLKFSKLTEKLLNNKEKQLDMSRAGIARAKKFSIETIVEEWIKIL